MVSSSLYLGLTYRTEFWRRKMQSLQDEFWVHLLVTPVSLQMLSNVTRFTRSSVLKSSRCPRRVTGKSRCAGLPSNASPGPSHASLASSWCSSPSSISVKSYYSTQAQPLTLRRSGSSQNWRDFHRRRYAV